MVVKLPLQAGVNSKLKGTNIFKMWLFTSENKSNSQMYCDNYAYHKET